MKEHGIMVAILRIARTVILIVVIVFAIVGVIGLVLRWHTPAQFSSAFNWAGAILVIFGVLTLSGGITTDAGDLVAYSLTGAGNMSEHLKRLAQNRLSRHGCLIVLLLAAVLPVLVGFLLKLSFWLK
jgi:hypothetical protein